MKVCFITCSCIPASPFYCTITLLHKTHQPVQYFITQSESFLRLILQRKKPVSSACRLTPSLLQTRLDQDLAKPGWTRSCLPARANIPVAFFLASCQNFRAYVFLYFHHQKHQQFASALCATWVRAIAYILAYQPQLPITLNGQRNCKGEFLAPPQV